MAVVIGFGTTVGGDFSAACATSVSWGYNPNVQRLYCLGLCFHITYNQTR